MNVLYLKYAIEVAKYGSINKAAEVLYVAQPNISRAIKELESQLDITIFERNNKGMSLTPEGEILIQYANRIIKQMDEVENLFKNKEFRHNIFSISVPRATYIAYAFASFTKHLSKNMQCEVFYKETNSSRTITNLLNNDFHLGIIRYADKYDKYFKLKFEEKNIKYEKITSFQYVILTSKDSPLAKLDKVTYRDLVNYIEIAHADPYVPSLPSSVVRKDELSVDINRRIYVYERGSQFEILSSNKETFMWVSPIPKETLERFNLVMIKCDENKKIYNDVLIYQDSYVLSELDRQFIGELFKAKHKYIDAF